MSEVKQYEMPKPHLFEIVQFYDEGNPQPFPGIVRGINPGSIDVVNLFNRMEYPGVRFVGDPTLAKNDDRFQYKWDFTEAGKIMRQLAEVLLPSEESSPAAADSEGSASK